jgi:hypothetical protein
LHKEVSKIEVLKKQRYLLRQKWASQTRKTAKPVVEKKSQRNVKKENGKAGVKVAPDETSSQTKHKRSNTINTKSFFF